MLKPFSLLLLLALVLAACASPPDAGNADATPTTDAGNVTPLPTATAVTPAPPPIATPTSAPAATATPVPASQAALQEHMLTLINGDRAVYDLPAVALGTNAAAQDHAEDMLEHSYLAHWGRDGMKPYMRYTLAEGMDYAAENMWGTTAPLPDDAESRRDNPLEELTEVQAHFMDDPEQRANVLDPWHKRVSLGIACDEYTCAVVQLFEGGYLAFEAAPAIDGRELSMRGRFLASDAVLDYVVVWYDETPRPLTFGQLGVSHAYGTGQTPAAFLRPPPEEGFYYEDDEVPYEWHTPVDPYAVDPSTPRPEYCRFCVRLTPSYDTHAGTFPWISADEWAIDGQEFSLEADLTPAIRDLGDGVYTIVIWGSINREPLRLSNYSLFVE